MRVFIVFVLAGLFFVSAVPTKPSAPVAKHPASVQPPKKIGSVDQPKQSDPVEKITEGVSNLNPYTGPTTVSTALAHLSEMDRVSDFVY